MRLVSKALVGAAGVLLLTLVVAISSLGQALAQGRPDPFHVLVDNASSSPVPVAPQGTTSIGGSVNVSNSAAAPVPVREQNTDSSGAIKVHEQGIAKVSVTNTSFAVTTTPGGDQVRQELEQELAAA